MPTTFKDYYATLGVSRTATDKEIRSAYRKLARKYHPDVNKDKGGLERFKEVNEANEVLGDPEKRKKYDELGPQWQQYQQWEQAGRPGGGNPFSGGGGGPFNPFGGGPNVQYRTATPGQLEDLFGNGQSPFSDFFHTVFGRGGGTAPREARGRHREVVTEAPRGGDVEGEVTVSLEEAYTGTTRTVQLSGDGSTRQIEVRIPAGISDGARVRAAGQGGKGQRGARSGDLLIRVRITPHPTFVREGDNLRTRAAVPLDVALLGGSVEVPTPKGTRVHLSVPPETQNGARLRLRGQGMPQLKGGGHGDLIAEVDVRLPVPLNEAAREAAERLRAAREA
ncbi:MAG: DnaJ C-terminal domain-containing protein [Candidatus Dormibacteria bacterium]